MDMVARARQRLPLAAPPSLGFEVDHGRAATLDAFPVRRRAEQLPDRLVRDASRFKVARERGGARAIEQRREEKRTRRSMGCRLPRSRAGKGGEGVRKRRRVRQRQRTIGLPSRVSRAFVGFDAARMRM
jgi:hypothetical protein